jgi:hypothetical protein
MEMEIKVDFEKRFLTPFDEYSGQAKYSKIR